MLIFVLIEIDLSAVEQLVERSQTNAIGDVLRYFKDHKTDGPKTMNEVMHAMDSLFDTDKGCPITCSRIHLARSSHCTDLGLDVLDEGRHRGNYARPRVFEMAAAVNRLRVIEMQQQAPDSVF